MEIKVNDIVNDVSGTGKGRVAEIIENGIMIEYKDNNTGKMVYKNFIINNDNERIIYIFDKNNQNNHIVVNGIFTESKNVKLKDKK